MAGVGNGHQINCCRRIRIDPPVIGLSGWISPDVVDFPKSQANVAAERCFRSQLLAAAVGLRATWNSCADKAAFAGASDNANFIHQGLAAKSGG